MAIADFQGALRPVLATVQNGTPMPLNELRERVAEQFQLSEDERKQRRDIGGQLLRSVSRRS
jgi:restriction system protein